MNFLTYLPHFREYFTDLPRTSSTTPTKSASTSKSTSASLSSSLQSIFLTLLAIPILLPITFIATIAYIEYHRLPCTISWVKRLRTSIALAAGCCCRVCLRMADGTKTTEREEGDMGGNGIGDGEESGEGEKEEQEQEQEGNGTTARKGWYRDLGQRERYGKLFKNSSGGSEGDEMLLRDMEGSEDGLAVLL